ncbi:urease accessory protein UreD [Vagococcus jeotgali]|uniref:urease accessory protein UreD n=1 Tax=Vagococcus jeotgali TaxID=3109030 RepID=UPI002DDB546C|nr:urease accessory protein UreD [Vagococcus sp. B2T-5]
MDKEFQGIAHIEFMNREGCLVSDKVYNSGNSKVSSLIDLDHERLPCHFLIGMGGGLVEGEKYLLEIKVGRDARGIVSSQAPTYVYKCDNNLTTKQETNINIEKNGVLEYISDAVIPYKDSIYHQIVDINLDESSVLIYSDGITSGWSPDQKKFQYKQVKIKTNVYMDNILVCSDFILLNPVEADLTSIGYFEGFSNYGSMLIISPDVDKVFLEDLRKNVNQLKEDGIEWGASLLEVPGLSVRVLGDSDQMVQKMIMLIANFSRQRLLNSSHLSLRKNIY